MTDPLGTAKSSAPPETHHPLQQNGVRLAQIPEGGLERIASRAYRRHARIVSPLPDQDRQPALSREIGL